MDANDSQNVLLVEDDMLVAAALHKSVSHWGESDFTVCHAANMSTALEKLKDATMTAVILDLNLADSQGIDTFDAVVSRYPKLPILILSGRADEALAIETVKRGAQDYLVKGRDSGLALVRAIRYAIERKRSELEKQDLQSAIHQERRLEALGEVTSGVAHEINTPLQFVKANVEFLALSFTHLRGIIDHCVTLCGEDLSDEDTLKSVAAMRADIEASKVVYIKGQLDNAIDETKSGVDRIVRIVRAMNVFSRKPHEDKVRYDVNRAVRDAILISRGEWKKCSSLTLTLSEDLPLVHCYPEELSQAILNLIVNAAHSIRQKLRKPSNTFTEAQKGVITVSTRLNEQSETVEVLVGDSGVGIPTEIRHRVFEPFFTTKVVGEGSGQGLSYVYNSIVKRHDGTVEFDSREEEGTVFRMNLPITRRTANVSKGIDGEDSEERQRKAGATNEHSC